jgi:hypothetical protein
MAANRPTEESYRSDVYAHASNSTPGRIGLKKSFSKHGSGGSVKFADAAPGAAAPAHEHFEIPEEDITTYTEEEKSLFETFNKASSAIINFGGVYEEDDDTYGENYDIPVTDGPAYTEEEIIKFDLFQKAKSACIQFDGVYDSDEEFEGGYSKASDTEDAEVYTDTEMTVQQPALLRVPSAFVQFGVYDDEEERSYVEYNELRFQNVPAKAKPPLTQGSSSISPAPSAAATAAAPSPYIEQPVQMQDDAKGTDASGNCPVDGTSRDVGTRDWEGTLAAGQENEGTGLADSEGNELDGSGSPGQPALSKSRQGSLTLETIAEGREGEECSPVLTPVSPE